MKESLDELWGMPKEEFAHQIQMGIYLVSSLVILIAGIKLVLYLRFKKKFDKEWEDFDNRFKGGMFK